MKTKHLAVLAIAAGVFILLIRKQAGLEQAFFKATQYGSSWEPLPQDAGKVIYV